MGLVGQFWRILLYGRDTGGNETELENETTGELRIVVMGHDGAVPQRLGTETSRELRVEQLGQDEAGNPDVQRTDPSRIPWRRDYPAYVQVDPVAIPSPGEDILWNPGADATELYEVSFIVVNNDTGGAAVTVSLGVDLAAGGALAAPEYWMFSEVIPYPGTSGWRGPYLIAGDDDIRGIASAAGDASIHFRIRRVDTGA